MLIGVQLTGAGIRFWGGGAGCAGSPSATNLCPGNGEVMLGYGSAPYIGLGFSVFLIFLLIEIFGRYGHLGPTWWVCHCCNGHI